MSPPAFMQALTPQFFPTPPALRAKPVRVFDLDAAYLSVMGGRKCSTRRLSNQLHRNYYTVLAQLKAMELRGLVVRVGVDRRIKAEPSIIWQAK